MWIVCASVLVALDAAVLYVASWSVWITTMVLVISAALGSYRHRYTLTLSEGDGRYVILTAAVMVPMLVLDEPPGSDVLFTVLVLVSLLVSRTVGFWLVKQIRRRLRHRVFIAGKRRLGLRGREFTMLKFRTMRVTDTADTVRQLVHRSVLVVPRCRDRAPDRRIAVSFQAVVLRSAPPPA